MSRGLIATQAHRELLAVKITRRACRWPARRAQHHSELSQHHAHCRTAVGSRALASRPTARCAQRLYVREALSRFTRPRFSAAIALKSQLRRGPPRCASSSGREFRVPSTRIARGMKGRGNGLGMAIWGLRPKAAVIRCFRHISGSGGGGV